MDLCTNLSSSILLVKGSLHQQAGMNKTMPSDINDFYQRVAVSGLGKDNIRQGECETLMIENVSTLVIPSSQSFAKCSRDILTSIDPLGHAVVRPQ